MKSLRQVKLSIAAVLLLSVGLLAMINWDIVKREAWLAEGEVVRLELAPVDPRSLMQGDYMTLNYQIMATIRSKADGDNLNGYVRVKRNADLVAQFVAFEANYLDASTLPENELLLQVRLRGQVKLATNAFFFQEGQGERFEAAQYGEFRVNEQGELLLDALLDQDLQKL
ncbi:GDYXXLXY domain-containing protein [Motilimonas cestriensis]|uniref:GDYXXLXY domain-containing protein n=1 Tax=Motilimonas cestriensis TaxID=2742685 RepID=A0ABS8WCZ9_9GAMM|nr:GDYXXLXY domain-containing protein [Motilimonas cestriensis]MCE2596917.1 GDYXXLXY domain-containing protein [Motilimonas cestriensis]